MATTMQPTMTWNHPSMHGYGYSDPTMGYNQHHMMAPYLQPAPNTMPTVPHMQRTELVRPSQSGPWTQAEDEILLDAKSQGLSWEEIHRQHFPGKSANACRKRHERCLMKMKRTDWDEARIQRVRDAYIRNRPMIWAPLVNDIGETLEDIERVVSLHSIFVLKISAYIGVCSCSNKDSAASGIHQEGMLVTVHEPARVEQH
jgi:hypothetical protein